MGNLLSITKSVSLKILITCRIYKWWILWILIQQGHKSKYSVKNVTNLLYSEIMGVFSSDWSYLPFSVKKTYLISYLRVFPLLVDLYCFLLIQENRSKEDERQFNFLSSLLSQFIELMNERKWNFCDQYSIVEAPAMKLYQSLDKIFQLKNVNTDDLENSLLFDKSMDIPDSICIFYRMMRLFYPLHG